MSSPKLPSINAYEAHAVSLDTLDHLSRRALRSAIVAYGALRGEEETIRELKEMQAQHRQLMAVLHGQVEGWISAEQKLNRRGLHNAKRETILSIINDLYSLLRQLDEDEETEAKETAFAVDAVRAEK